MNTHLSDSTKASAFVWSIRVNVLLQLATGYYHQFIINTTTAVIIIIITITIIILSLILAINYLHCSISGQPAYHRDIKSSNVALTSDYTGYYTIIIINSINTLLYSSML